MADQKGGPYRHWMFADDIPKLHAEFSLAIGHDNFELRLRAHRDGSALRPLEGLFHGPAGYELVLEAEGVPGVRCAFWLYPAFVCEWYPTDITREARNIVKHMCDEAAEWRRLRALVAFDAGRYSKDGGATWEGTTEGPLS